MMKWEYEMKMVYDSDLSASDCFDQLINPRASLDDEFNPVDFEVTNITESQLSLVYKGRRFSKYRRTEYTMDFSFSNLTSMQTQITVTFVGESLGCPFPMTSVQELDSFMEERINAYRRK